ncbi:MAG TPA: GNAT family N-acetyltransferase [Caulobacteraceae bacterium]|nr:GNAT family N-acetyltransferase [Caulobacteraceae bacterium]
MAVALVPASIGDKPMLRQMLESYLVELSAFDPAITPDYPYLDIYWAGGEARWPILITQDGGVAGFALIRSADDGGGAEMAEFYVRPDARRSGAGLAAAVGLFKAHPGAWTLSILLDNGPARAFWPRAIAAAKGERVSIAEEERVVTYRFTIPT